MRKSRGPTRSGSAHGSGGRCPVRLLAGETHLGLIAGGQIGGGGPRPRRAAALPGRPCAANQAASVAVLNAHTNSHGDRRLKSYYSATESAPGPLTMPSGSISA